MNAVDQARYLRNSGRKAENRGRVVDRRRDDTKGGRDRRSFPLQVGGMLLRYIGVASIDNRPRDIRSSGWGYAVYGVKERVIACWQSCKTRKGIARRCNAFRNEITKLLRHITNTTNR